MEAQFAGVAELRRTLIDEIFNAMGFRRVGCGALSGLWPGRRRTVLPG